MCGDGEISSPWLNTEGIPFLINCINDTTMCQIPGCMDESACNYNPDVNIDDGTCVYETDLYDCDGNCTAGTDCNGECGGSAIEFICGEGLAVDFPCGSSGCAVNVLEVCGPIPDGHCDCDGNVLDCNGDCGGDLEFDECQVCGGQCSPNLGIYDECVECCTITDGEPPYEKIYTCDGWAPGNQCFGYDTNNNGICDEYELPGCMDSDACNYNPSATVDNDTCVYPILVDGICSTGADNGDNQITDLCECNGTCIPGYGCDNVCGSGQVEDACGVCNGNAIGGEPYCGEEPGDNCCDCAGKKGQHFEDCNGECFSNVYLNIFFESIGFCLTEDMYRDVGYIDGICLTDTNEEDPEGCGQVLNWLTCGQTPGCSWKSGLWWHHPDEFGLADDFEAPGGGFKGFANFGEFRAAVGFIPGGKYPDFDCATFSEYQCQKGDCIYASDVDGDGNLDYNCGCVDYGGVENINLIHCPSVSGCGAIAGGEYTCSGIAACYSPDACGECGGNCWTTQNPNPQTGATTCPDNAPCRDCAGIVNGNSDTDECGVCFCGYDNPDEGEIDRTPECEDVETYQGKHGIGVNSDQDCTGVCNGDSTIDNCGNCTLNQSDNYYQDCQGTCQEDEIDACGYYTECNPNDYYNPLCTDKCGMDTCGVCGGINTLDCLGTDRCLEEMSPGTMGMDCHGDCVTWETYQEYLSSGSGTFSMLDECGICWEITSDMWNSSCTGCTDENACNYTEGSTIDDGSCQSTLTIQETEQSGNTQPVWDSLNTTYGLNNTPGHWGTDCNGVCGGWNILDECGNCYCELESHPFYGAAVFETSLMMGDSNNDGLVGLPDILYTVSYLLGRMSLSTTQKKTIDLNKDGKSDINDFIEIVKNIRNIGEKSSKFSNLEIEILDEILNRFKYSKNSRGKQTKFDLKNTNYVNRELKQIETSLKNLVHGKNAPLLNFLNWNDYNNPQLFNEESGDNGGGNMITITLEDYCGDTFIDSVVEKDECGVCGGDNSTCTGCMDFMAENYDIEAIVPCNDVYDFWQEACTENDVSGENCCCNMPDASVITNSFTQEISTILSGNTELLDIYNKLLEGNQSCVDMLNDINLAQADYSSEAICAVLVNMAGGQYGQCYYGNDNTCEPYCGTKCSMYNGVSSMECTTLNVCECTCNTVIDEEG